jgi:hypothetical protein
MTVTPQGLSSWQRDNLWVAVPGGSTLTGAMFDVHFSEPGLAQLYEGLCEGRPDSLREVNWGRQDLSGEQHQAERRRWSRW